MTINKTLLVIQCIFLTHCSFAQSVPNYIIFHKPFTDSSETNLYNDTVIKFNYNVQYTNIKSADIKKDVENAIRHNDLRIVAISGNSYLYPGLEGGYEKLKDGRKAFIGLSKKYEDHLTKYSFKVIEGTSDAINEGDPPLQSVAYDYAKKYNMLLFKRIAKKENVSQ